MKYKSLRSILNVLPELYLILAVIYYWILTSSVLNPVAIVLLLVLAYQLYTKKQILGIIIASIFIFLNCYMVLALLSELSEFYEFNNQAQQLAIVGFLYLGFNIIVGSIMLIQYINKTHTEKEKHYLNNEVY